jgi:serine/threonine protein kinase
LFGPCPSLAHKELADKGILHRDISSGNILIAKYEKDEGDQEQEDGEDEKGSKDEKGEKGKKEKADEARPAGLLTDVELAKILPGHDPRLQSIIPTITKTGPDFTVGNDLCSIPYSKHSFSVHCILLQRRYWSISVKNLRSLSLLAFDTIWKASFMSQFGRY